MDMDEIRYEEVEEIEYYDDFDTDTSSKIYFNFHDITYDDMNNGDGLRVVLWMSGCNHRCPGCQNPETWSSSSGIPYTMESEIELFDYLSKPWIDGITFSGGDPLFPGNRDAVKAIIEKMKSLYPEKTVWLYTGYTLKKSDDDWFFKDECPWIKEHDSFTIDWLDKLDVVVDGPFDQSVRKLDLEKKSDPYWCGSSNQRVIDIQESLSLNKIVLYETK